MRMAGKRGKRGFGNVRRLPSGRYRASYSGPDGARHAAPITFTAKSDAEGWLRDERVYLERTMPDEWSAPGVRAQQAAVDLRTVREYSDEWLARKVRATTREKDEQQLRLRVWPKLGDVRVVELSRAQVSAWWRGLDHDHPRACDLAYQALRAVMNHAVADGLIETNPCQVKGAGGGSRRRTIEPLTPAAVQACADEMPDAWSIGVLLGAWCALRSGEIRELRRRDVDLKAERPLLRVRRGVVRAAGQLQVGSPKSDAGYRRVYLPGPMVEVMRRHLRDHTQLGPDGLLIWSPVTGGHVHDSSWGRAWRRASGRAGVQGFRFHDLRHTGLTYAAVAGATVRELQEMAGHTTAAMAMRYQEVASGHMAEVVDRLGVIISSRAAEPS